MLGATHTQNDMLERLQNYQASLIQSGAEASEAQHPSVFYEIAWPWCLLFFVGGLIFMATDLAGIQEVLRSLLSLPLLFLPVLGMIYAMSVFGWAYIRTDFARYEAMKTTRQRAQAGVDGG